MVWKGGTATLVPGRSLYHARAPAIWRFAPYGIVDLSTFSEPCMAEITSREETVLWRHNREARRLGQGFAGGALSPLLLLYLLRQLFHQGSCQGWPCLPISSLPTCFCLHNDKHWFVSTRKDEIPVSLLGYIPGECSKAQQQLCSNSLIPFRLKYDNDDDCVPSKQLLLMAILFRVFKVESSYHSLLDWYYCQAQVYQYKYNLQLYKII